jgi:hypothetical protein
MQRVEQLRAVLFASCLIVCIAVSFTAVADTAVTVSVITQCSNCQRMLSIAYATYTTYTTHFIRVLLVHQCTIGVLREVQQQLVVLYI